MQYRSNTNGVEVIVRPEYIDCKINDNGSGFFIWSYHIDIENKSNDILQLISRYWKIIDEDGLIREISGSGAIGEHPILAPNDSFKYSSGVQLRYSSGIMSGHYKMKRSDGKIINIKIPAFSLDVPNIKSVIN